MNQDCNYNNGRIMEFKNLTLTDLEKRAPENGSVYKHIKRLSGKKVVIPTINGANRVTYTNDGKGAAIVDNFETIFSPNNDLGDAHTKDFVGDTVYTFQHA